MSHLADIKPDKHDELWLKALYKKGFEKQPDEAELKAKLHGKIPNEYYSRNIDVKLFRDGWITIFGLYLVIPKAPELDWTHQAILEIKKRVKAGNLGPFKAKDFTKPLGLTQRQVEIAFGFTQDVGLIMDGNTGYADRFGKSQLNLGPHAVPYYLSYSSLASLLEEDWRNFEEAGNKIARMNQRMLNKAHASTRNDLIYDHNTRTLRDGEGSIKTFRENSASKIIFEALLASQAGRPVKKAGLENILKERGKLDSNAHAVVRDFNQGLEKFNYRKEPFKIVASNSTFKLSHSVEEKAKD